MKNLNIPVGISDFERIRELNYYHVDKTGLIKTLLQGEMDQKYQKKRKSVKTG